MPSKTSDVKRRIERVTGVSRGRNKRRSYYGKMSVRQNPKTGNWLASGSAQGFSLGTGQGVSRKGQMLSRRQRYGQVRAALGLSSG